MSNQLIETVKLSSKLIGIAYEKHYGVDPNDKEGFEIYSLLYELQDILNYALDNSGYEQNSIEHLTEIAQKLGVI